MRGPIDFIIVGFKGNKFDGSILKALADALEKGIINLIALALVTKDKNGNLTAVDITESNDEFVLNIVKRYKPKSEYITQDDLDEMSDLLENETAAGMLVVEHVWAVPLKQAIVDAGGVLVADGRIHPDAAAEIK